MTITKPIICMISIVLILVGCALVDHSWKGWVGGGYTIGEGKDDPTMDEPVDLDSDDAENPDTIIIKLPPEMQPAVEPGPVADPEVEAVDPAADPNAETYLCIEEKGFLECAKPPDDPMPVE